MVHACNSDGCEQEAETRERQKDGLELEADSFGLRLTRLQSLSSPNAFNILEMEGAAGRSWRQNATGTRKRKRPFGSSKAARQARRGRHSVSSLHQLGVGVEVLGVADERSRSAFADTVCVSVGARLIRYRRRTKGGLSLRAGLRRGSAGEGDNGWR
ncbi:hypothetical protein NL676_001966 [Syzygium grande]|nr:hypothetical protein NL676_001966 [Syzygium grande]